MIGSSSTPLTPYEPRHFHCVGETRMGSLRLKLYTIRRDPNPLDLRTMEAAWAYLERHLPAIAEEEGDHHGLAFAILHEGTEATWLLMHWWAHGDILCQRIAHTDSDGGFVGTDRPFHGCVWEGVVVTHEHRAWVHSMLTDAPDPEGYMRSVLPDGAY